MPIPNARGQVLAGIAGNQSSVDGVLLPLLGGAQWLDDDTVIGQSLDATRLVAVKVSDLSEAGVAPHGANTIVAGGGRWASFLEPASGVLSQVDGALGSRPGASLYAAGSDGTIAWKRVYQASAGLTLSGPNGTVVDVPTANPRDVQVIDYAEAIWSEAPGVHGAIGRAIPRPAVLSQHVRLVTTPDGVDWLIVAGQNGGLFVHPDGETTGYVLVPAAQPAYNAEAALVHGELFVTWAVVNREIPSDVRSLTVDRSQPRVSLVAAVPIPPINRQCAIGWFAFGDPGDAPGNVRLMVDAAMNLVDLATGEVIAHYVAGASDSDTAAIDAAIAQGHHDEPGVPILAYWPRQAQAIRLPIGAEMIGVEAYQGVNETSDAFEARIRAVVAVCPAAFLIAQAFTSNASLTADLSGIPPVVARINRDCRNVLGILAFSAGARATGWNDHPEIHDAWKQVAASSLGVPVFPQPHAAPQPSPAPAPVPAPHPVPAPKPAPVPVRVTPYPAARVYERTT